MSIYDEISPWYDLLFPVGEEQAAFFHLLLGAEGAGSVLDAGCGTGRHMEIFAQLGLRVAGLEPEARMAAAARERLARLGLGEAAAPILVAGIEAAGGGPFDAAVCLGNTIAHLDAALLERGLRALASVVRPGGLLVTQTVNFDAVLRERSSPFAARTITAAARGELVFRRAYDFARAPESLGFELSLTGEGVRLAETLTLRPYRIAEQERALAAAGFAQPRRIGNWGGEPWNDNAAATIIVSRRS